MEGHFEGVVAQDESHLHAQAGAGQGEFVGDGGLVASPERVDAPSRPRQVLTVQPPQAIGSAAGKALAGRFVDVAEWSGPVRVEFDVERVVFEDEGCAGVDAIGPVYSGPHYQECSKHAHGMSSREQKAAGGWGLFRNCRLLIADCRLREHGTGAWGLGGAVARERDPTARYQRMRGAVARERDPTARYQRMRSAVARERDPTARPHRATLPLHRLAGLAYNLWMLIGLITLGCDKNTVDNEYVAGLFEARGCGVVFEPMPGTAALDAVVILTCGFIADAKRQSVETLVAWAEHKARTGGPRLYASGCLAQRHAAELLEAIPEIDGIAGVGQFGKLVELVLSGEGRRNVTRRAPVVEIDAPMPRRRADARPWSFLKIADGCNHGCTFCSIPLMKGPLRSVPQEILLGEAAELVNGGVKEITLVAQDISVYGRDRKDAYGLPDLLRDLCAIRGDFWVRCMYCYPGGITGELLEVMASERKVAPYLDVPLQHVDSGVLERMRRPFANVNPRRLVDRLRDAVPGIAIRTTMIVGFPGETPAEHRRMIDGIRELRFDWLGAFPYSREPDTAAASAPRQVGKAVRQKRWEAVMAAQAEVSEEISQGRIGGVERVLVEGYDENRKSWVGRSGREAPEVDGLVLLESGKKLRVGEFVKVKITGADVYDVAGRVAPK